MMDLKGKIERRLQRLTNMHRQSKKNWLSLFLFIKRLQISRGFNFVEIHDNELDLGTPEYLGTFLNYNEQKVYLELLNPRLYSRIARNKYLTHVMLEAAGITAKSRLYVYYNPELGYLNENETANSTASVVRILRSKDVMACVIKTTEDSHGDNVRVARKIEYTGNDAILECSGGTKIMLSELLGKEPLIFESLIHQTDQMSGFNDTSVNTVRFMTTLFPNGEAKIIATFIKIGRKGAWVDNAGGGGNIDAGIDTATGILYNAICFNGWRKIDKIDNHPDSGVRLEGVKIRDWDNIKKQVLEFQKAMPFVKAAGWDIAITDNGPVIIEINDMWDRTGQLFLKRGWKPEIRECYDAWREFYKK